MGRYKDEGPVEVFYNGSWGFVGNPGLSLDDTTASYLCKQFGLSDVGFSVTAHPLDKYGREAWLDKLYCDGNETNIMQCKHPQFSTVPILMHTYRRGTWLYCFSFNVTSIRLSGGTTANEGRVELLINRRWGSISTFGSLYYDTENVAKIICSQLGYSGLEQVYHSGNVGRNDDLFWMSEVHCKGDEKNITDCYYRKGQTTPAFGHPVYLKIRCRDGSNGKSGSPIVG